MATAKYILVLVCLINVVAQHASAMPCFSDCIQKCAVNKESCRLCVHCADQEKWYFQPAAAAVSQNIWFLPPAVAPTAAVTRSADKISSFKLQNKMSMPPMASPSAMEDKISLTTLKKIWFMPPIPAPMATPISSFKLQNKMSMPPMASLSATDDKISLTTLKKIWFMPPIPAPMATPTSSSMKYSDSKSL